MGMKSAIQKLILGRSCKCSICGKYAFCQHQDDELRGDICFVCIPHLGQAENLLRGFGFQYATEWDE